MNDMHNNIIGKVATYEGDAHPYLRGRTVCVMFVVKRPDDDPDNGIVCDTNEELAAAGGLDAANDIIEVVAWLPKYQRWGAIPSDVKLADLRNLRETR